ncbi:hypothetical protein K503DRAFT_804157 [Rhizopogon vinicolor AM-OR11-026]|uniref:Ricin B lectin domain-containing protein n=1 Tax=Rhizopogon vinicolor AM-OR11-026 TaxID=1314800 RepID=A0A1B7MM65_9AGAM|nr:hypothetical protein K503DRAFT_804157 [Rhizopogon vinicolor AM-OR11-026]
MSIPCAGTYRLRSVKYPNQLFDLQGGSATAGTPIIGYGNNHESQNMLWTMQVVDMDSKTVRLIDVASGTFAQCGTPQKAGVGVVGNPTAGLFKIAPMKNLGEFAICTTDGQLACCLANANNYTQVTLQKANDSDSSQGWMFCTA